MNTTATIIIIAILVLAFIAIYGLLFFKMIKAREEAYGKTLCYEVVCAGDYKKGVKAIKKSVSITDNKFLDYEGKALDTNKYDHYIVAGNSMKLCGVNEGDILFVPKDFTTSQLRKNLPQILVIKRRNAQKEEAKYKVRHTWIICNINEDFSTLLLSLKDIPSFKSLLNTPECDGLDKMIEDFLENRLLKYKEHYPDCNNANSIYHEVVVSTTLHTDSNCIRFSVHPTVLIKGIVQYSFTVKD